MTVAQIFTHAFTFFDVFGVVLAGVLGGMVAREERFDLVGFVALAVMVALGGGMLRDALLQKGPPVALTNPFYIGGAFLGALIAFAMRMTGKWWNRFFIVADAFVVSTWAATGAIKTLDAGYGVGPAMLLGVITGVGGGMFRDIAVGRTPAIFGGNTLYATGALVATWPAIVLWNLHKPFLALVSGMAVGGVLCVAARRFKWKLPVNNDYSLTQRVRVSFEEYARAKAVERTMRLDKAQREKVRLDKRRGEKWRREKTMTSRRRRLRRRRILDE